MTQAEAIHELIGEYAERIDEDRLQEWPDLFGGAKYVSENRHIPAEIYEQAGRALCAPPQNQCWGFNGPAISADVFR